MDELRAKVERAVWAFDQANALIPLPMEGPMDVVVEAARLWLAAEPADGGEPVTEARLLRAGFVPRVPDDAILTRGSLAVVVWGGPCGWRVDDDPLPKRLYPKTMADVYRLLAALGVPVREGK